MNINNAPVQPKWQAFSVDQVVSDCGKVSPEQIYAACKNLNAKDLDAWLENNNVTISEAFEDMYIQDLANFIVDMAGAAERMAQS